MSDDMQCTCADGEKCMNCKIKDSSFSMEKLFTPGNLFNHLAEVAEEVGLYPLFPDEAEEVDSD